MRSSAHLCYFILLCIQTFKYCRASTNVLQKRTVISNVLGLKQDECIITYAGEGSKQDCQCPDGYVLCNWQDVEMERRAGEKSNWQKALCDNSTSVGFKNFIVYIDYELQLICSNDGTKELPKLEYVHMGSGNYLDPNLPKNKQDTSFVARSCMDSDLYLCKKSNHQKVDCEFTEWSEWGQCKNEIKARHKSVLRSGQHGGEVCIVNGTQPRQNLITETLPCF